MLKFTESYLLDSIDSYRFLVNGGLNLPNVDDAVEFRNTLNSMSIMGFADEKIDCEFFRLKNNNSK